MSEDAQNIPKSSDESEPVGPLKGAGERQARLDCAQAGIDAGVFVTGPEQLAEFRVLQAQLIAEFEPSDGIEISLVAGIARAEWRRRLPRLARIAHIQQRTEEARDREDAEIDHDLNRLFSMAHRIFRTHRDEPDRPCDLMARLEARVRGCETLIETWRSIAERVENDLDLRPNERFKAIRMLGKQPIDAAQDQQVWLIFVASFILHPQGKNHPFEDLIYEVSSAEREAFIACVRSGWTKPLDTTRAKKAKQFLLDLCGKNIARLEASLKALVDNADERAAATASAEMLAYDASPAGARLARYQISCATAVRQSRAAFWRYRREKKKWNAQGQPKAKKGRAASKAKKAGHPKTESRVFVMASARDIKNLTTKPDFHFGASEAGADQELEALTVARRWALRMMGSPEQ